MLDEQVCLIWKLSTRKVLFSFKTVQARTTRLERRRKMNRNGPKSRSSQPKLPISARKKVIRAAAFTISLDTQLLPFCDGYYGMNEFAIVIFEMGHFANKL